MITGWFATCQQPEQRYLSSHTTCPSQSTSATGPPPPFVHARALTLSRPCAPHAPQAVFDLPKRMRAALEEDVLDTAVNFYAESQPLLKKYGSRGAFRQIAIDSDQVAREISQVGVAGMAWAGCVHMHHVLCCAMLCKGCVLCC